MTNVEHCLLVLVLSLFDVTFPAGDSDGSQWTEHRTKSKDGYTGPLMIDNSHHSKHLCREGKFQSPINVEPRMLLYDPGLRQLDIRIPDRVSGALTNTGHDIVFEVDAITSNLGNLSGGPLMYTYRLAEIRIKIGTSNARGSEHRIDGWAFSAEVQLICFNSDLSDSLHNARHMPYGVTIISVFVEAQTHHGNSAFTALTDAATRVPWKGQVTRVPNLKVKDLLPSTAHYVTYEGSFTQPDCLETVTWILFNKPINVQSTKLDTLRYLQKQGTERSGSPVDTRDPMPLHNRPIRTNINYPVANSFCSMKKDAFYQANDKILQ